MQISLDRKLESGRELESPQEIQHPAIQAVAVKILIVHVFPVAIQNTERASEIP